MDRDTAVLMMRGMGGDMRGEGRGESSQQMLKSIVDAKDTTRLTRIPPSVFAADAYKPAAPVERSGK